MSVLFVIPAQAGIQGKGRFWSMRWCWIPAFAGMTLSLTACTQHHKEQGYIPLDEVPPYPIVADTEVRVSEVQQLEQERKTLTASLQKE